MTLQSSILIRAGGLRAVTAFVSNIMLCLVLISSLPVMWLWPFGGEYHPTVEVRDDAHLFQPAPLVAEIKSMEFRRKVHVVVLTIPKVNEASLNEEVLAYVRHHGDGASKWISALRVRGCARWDYRGVQVVGVRWSLRPPVWMRPRNPRACRLRKAVSSGQVKVVSGTSRSLSYSV